MSLGKTLTPVPEPSQKMNGGIKGATRRLLLESAMGLIRDGHVPSLPEVAKRAEVSRATAYRYFPSRSALITAVIDWSLGPVRTFATDEPDGRKRVTELFTSSFPRFKDFEPQMRAALQLSLEHWALERAGLLDEEPYRRGHRIAILRHAIEPLKSQLTAKALDRLHKALSVVYGIEPYVVLKDIWGLDDKEVENIALWIADTLVAATLQQVSISKKANTPRSIGEDGAQQRQ